MRATGAQVFALERSGALIGLPGVPACTVDAHSSALTACGALPGCVFQVQNSCLTALDLPRSQAWGGRSGRTLGQPDRRTVEPARYRSPTTDGPPDRPTVRRPRQHHPLRAAPSTACRLPHHPLRAAPTAAPTRPPRRPDRSTVSTAALTRLPATDCRLPTHRPPRVAPQRRCPPHHSRTVAPSTARRADHHPVSTAAPSRPSYRTSRHADSTAAPSRPPATDLRPTDRLTTVPPCRPPYAAPTAAMRPVCR